MSHPPIQNANLHFSSTSATLLFMGSILGTMILGIVNSFMGRKQILIWFGLGATLFWMGTGLAENNMSVYAGFGLVSVMHDLPHDIAGNLHFWNHIVSW